MTVSEYISNYLAEKEIDTVYAVIGSASMWLFHALGDNKKIQTICTNHEQVAAMAATGWACLRNQPGVVFLTNGPGVTNALSGIAQAWTDSVPLIVINGEANDFTLRHEKQTGMRQYGSQSVQTEILAAPFVKYYHLLKDPSDVRKTLEKAYYISMDKRPGPVWISVPVNIQNAQIPTELKGFAPQDRRILHTKEIAKRVKKAMIEAKRPLVIAGQGVRQGNAISKFKNFIERYHIPVVTSRMGNDVLESNHPLFIGRPGNWGNRASHFAIQTADVILVLGSRLSLNTTGYSPEGFAPQARKFLVDIDPIEFNKPGITFEECIEQDVGVFLEELESAEHRDSCKTERDEWCARCRAWKEKYPVMNEEYKTVRPMSTYHFINRLSELSQMNDVILSDTGSCCNIVSQIWNVKKNQRLCVSGGLSCMGYWATSIGIARAKQNQLGQVLCIVGDGSLQMNIQELGTIVHYQLPIKLFVINNNGYQIIRISQQAYMDGDFFAISPETGVGLANTERVAAAYGIPYRKVEQPHEVDAAINWAFEQSGAAILEAIVGEDQLMLPRLTSKVQADGTLKSTTFEDLAPFLSDDELQCNLKG